MIERQLRCEPRIGEFVSIASPDTIGRYVGWGRALYVRVANDLAVSSRLNLGGETEAKLPMPSDGEVWMAYAAGGRVSEALHQDRLDWLHSIGMGVL